MTRTFVRRTLLTAAIAGAILSIGGMVSFSFYQSRTEEIAALEAGTAAWADELEAIFSEARVILAEMATKVPAKSLEQVREMLKQVVFDRPAFREAGMQRDGSLVCTSFSIVNPPVPAWDSEHAMIPLPGEVHFVPPSATQLGGPSLRVNYRVDDRTAVNVLIAPRTLTASLRYVAIRVDYAQYLLRSDGLVLAESEGARDLASPPATMPPLGLSYNDGSVFFRRPVGDFGVNVVAIMPYSVVMRRWYDSMPIYGLLGVVIAGLFLAGAWQLKSKLLGPEAELREAISTGQIEAFFQPVIDLKTGRCAGAEALARWRHPKRGLVPPALFVMAAEKAGLISPLTLAMIESVVKTLSATLRKNPGLRVNVNISSQSLNEPYFFSDCLHAIKGRIAPTQLCFEITESTLMGPAALMAMREFKQHGITLAVDDFGTGYSNLRYLKDFPFDCLKIDKAFVEGISSEEKSSGLVDHVINIGRSCGLSLVAEGVEMECQADYLRAAGVEYGQGYFFARPMPAEEFQDWLKENERQASEGSPQV